MISTTSFRIGVPAVAVLLAGLVSCQPATSEVSETVPETVTFDFPADNGGISLPAGFQAAVVADGLTQPRHMAITADNRLYVQQRNLPDEGGTLVCLYDANNDGKAEVTQSFGDKPGTGCRLYDGYLYYTTATDVLRRELGDSLLPVGPEEVVVSGLEGNRGHRAKPLSFDEQGWMYVTIGVPSNACQEERRTPGSPGMDPCPQLETAGGIWRFRADQLGQTFQDGQQYITGIRHMVGHDWQKTTSSLWGVQHGRDQLSFLFPELYTDEQSAELPAEELLEMNLGDNFGWPYCYFDGGADKKVQAPEYGGDGTAIGPCGDYERPKLAFPAHWAPNDFKFYHGTSFPEKYHEGAFVAFHGSWNRAPMPQQGYNVVFVPFEDGQPTGEYEVFADGFAGVSGPIESSGDAQYRPTGLVVGPDGSLYISDDAKGRIWRVVYTGEQ